MNLLAPLAHPEAPCTTRKAVAAAVLVEAGLLLRVQELWTEVLLFSCLYGEETPEPDKTQNNPVSPAKSKELEGVIPGGKEKTGESRFISEDPIRAGLNFYTYANNSPLSFLDVTGLDATDFYNNLTKTNGAAGTSDDYKTQIAKTDGSEPTQAERTKSGGDNTPPPPKVPQPPKIDFGRLAADAARSAVDFLTWGENSKADAAYARGEWGVGLIHTAFGVGAGVATLASVGAAGVANLEGRLSAQAVNAGTEAVRSGVQANRVVGQAAERLAGEELVAEGNTILGSQVSVRTPLGRRVVDHLIQTSEGNIVGVEVKAGGATRNSFQKMKDSFIENFGGTVIGKNSPDALRGQTIQFPTIVRQYP